MSEIIEWKPDSMLEIKIKEPDDFLKIRETLTRIGVASRKERLSDWGLVELVSSVENKAPLSQIKVLPFKEKNEWTLEPKYNIGKKGNEDGDQRTDNPSS